MLRLVFAVVVVALARTDAAERPDLLRGSDWLAVPDAPVATDADRRAQNAAPGASWFVGEVVNARAVRSAKWTTTGLGVYELYLNGERVGIDEALKPGFTHVRKTRRAFTTDVTTCFRREKGARNVLAAEVTAGWWRDQIVGYAGRKSAFRGVLELAYEDGSAERFCTDAKTWRCAIGGPVKRAAIFDGEIYDARIASPVFGDATFKSPEVSTEFRGEILPNNGAEVRRRFDLALAPVEAYCWKGVTGASGSGKEAVFGKIVKTTAYDPKGALKVLPGETLVVDFGQNCAAVPAFEFVAKPGVTLTCLPGEMLNDACGERKRGNDGPGGSVYRENLRIPATGMRLEYTFATDGTETYMPRHTFFGYRYVSISATDAVTILALKSIPVTSIARDMETGRIETGDKDVNRFISNVYWGQLSNYLSVPTDCPQRNERLGWTADTQVFAEAGSFNADTLRFFRKWTRDLRDSQGPEGGYPGVAPFAQYGNNTMRVGWADCGIIVPYQVWKQFGDTVIVEECWEGMERYMNRLAATKAGHAANVQFNGDYQWADWLSFEDLESRSKRAYETKGGKRVLRADAIRYWDYLAACYWMWDAQMMADMAAATGRDTAKWTRMSADAKKHLIANFVDKTDGLLVCSLRPLQTPAVFALKLGLLDATAAGKTLAALRENVRAHDGCLTTGFLGTSIIMDTLTAYGANDLAYSLLLNHRHPSWLYSVDQGATTVWERWNSYVKDEGFGPVDMNSFNHYAYGAVLAWIYKTVAGIAADPKAPGFKHIVMSPKPDRRLGYVKAEYKSAAGLIKSAWRYEGEKWIWEFTVPEGATASVTLPGEIEAKEYGAGSYRLEKGPGMTDGVIGKVLDGFVGTGRIAGVVSAVSDADYNVQFDCAGWADAERKVRISENTLFAIFSMTKSFLGVSLMCAIDEGRISLDDEVSKYLPEFADVKMKDGSRPKRPLVVRDLVCHVAGFRGGYAVVNRDIPLREVARKLAAQPLEFQPGETFSYGNSWICSAAACVEIAVGEPFEKYLQRKVLDPLGMKDTTFWPNEEQLTRLVRAYTSDARPFRPGSDRCTAQLLFPKKTRVYPAASGGLFSTPADMIRFSQMLAHHGQWKDRTIVSRRTFDGIFAVRQTGALKDAFPYAVGAWIWGDWIGHEGAMRTDQRANLKTGHSRVFFIQTENAAGPAFFQLKAVWHHACDELQGTPPTVFGT